MAAQGLVRVTTLRSFLSVASAAASCGVGTAYDLNPASSALTVYGGLHLVSCAAIAWTFKIQSASSSGFGTPSDRLTFSAQSCSGAQWATPIAMPAAPAEARWWRVSANPATTSDTRLGMVWVGVQ